MAVRSLPPVPYYATAVRPEWGELPLALRTAIGVELGDEIVAVRTATAGFTRGFAAVLETAAGELTFVKAAAQATQPELVDWYTREIAILDRLPAGLPAPRPRWTSTVGGWFAVGLDAVVGEVPRLPWKPTELTTVLDAYAEVAAALAEPPAELVALGMPTLAGLAWEDLSWWREITAGREPLPELPADPGPDRLLPADMADRLAELAALEALLPRYATTASGLIHCDLRLDNIIVERSGRAWICDWNWLCQGPAWFDLASLLLTGYASGLDVDRIFADHPAAAGAPPDALDATLAALGGYFLVRAGAGPSRASPHIRTHQRWSGELALSWLAERQGWR